MKISNKKVKHKEFKLENDTLYYNSNKEGAIQLIHVVYIDHTERHLAIYFNSTKTNKFKKLELIDLDGTCSAFVARLVHQHRLLTAHKDKNTLSTFYIPISTPNDFRDFLIHTQRDSVCNSTPNALSTVQFNQYLQSPHNTINSAHQSPLTLPLYDYYISASHNTYLFGNQLSGASSTIGYIRALLLGCRSVEIDVWNGDDGNPIVYHGHTLTQPIPLLEILTTVKNFAFTSSSLPLILSVENHCDLAQQEKMAQLCISVFGDSLVTERLHHDSDTLPSPEQLRNRILFKTKNQHIIQSNSNPIDDANSSSSEYSSSSDFERSKLSNFIHKVTRRTSNSSDRSSSSTAASPLVDSMGSVPSNSSNASNKMSQSLLNLLIYTVGVKFRGFNKKEHYDIQHMFSLSNRSARKLVNASSMEFIKHNRNHLTRIYPHGARVKSTNFEGLDYWAVGCQLIALNYQTVDLGMWLNFALFNGTEGFVLKPSPLRYKDDKWMLDIQSTKQVTIHVICGQQLPLDARQVSVEVFTPRSFNNGSLRQTTTVANAASSDMNPVWNDSLRFSINVMGNMTDLVVVKFNLHSSQSEDTIASYAITLANMRSGGL
ncbi:hypothetical protein E3P99_02782 [Wallemia hederae]|uniref:Phosphoinositide phospholipase C n=1 Tax=Wallemia hederae TaxID=1540922 RepID=A0A4T0FL20_9BASI|nr:hypothetical protein E3P99_02782 [Wallemia hederae]